MAKVWQIEGWDGDRLVFEREVAGNLTEPEVSAMLQRLTCRYLSDMEIIKASVRKGDPEYAPLLERIGTESLMCYGHGSRHVTAKSPLVLATRLSRVKY